MEANRVVPLNPDRLIERLEAHIEANLDNEQFGVEQLANLIGISRSQLHRKLQKINGKSISRFVREYRLERARKLLLDRHITASEAAYAVGFSSPSYFNKCFKEYFGYPPGSVESHSRRHVTERPSRSKPTTILPLAFGSIAVLLTSFLIFSLNKKDLVPDKESSKEKSILVMPFKNLSSNEENQYLADGMVEAINRHLSGIDDLKIISFSAPNPSNSIKEIGQKLGVANVVQGSIQRQDSTVRVEIKLVETSDESQVWAQSYDRNISDLLLLQSEIAKMVVASLQATITKEEQSIITKRTSYDPEAYDNYLKGMYFMNHLGGDSMDKALVHFEKAIAIDSTIAPCYAAIANYYHMKASIFSPRISSKKSFETAEKYLNLAMKFDPDWHFNYTIKAFQLTFFHWNFEEADSNHQIGLKAQKPLNYIIYRDFLQFENRHAEALEIARIMDRESPFYPNSPLIMPYYYNGMFQEGEEYIKERLASFPTNHLTLEGSGFFYLNTEQYDKAIGLFQELMEVKNKRLPRALAWMGAAYAKKGDSSNAIRLMNELKALKKKTSAGSPAFFIAIINVSLDNKEEAIKWLTLAIDEREMEIPWLVSEPQFYPLHGTPEFDALVKRVGFRAHAYPVELPHRLP